MRMMITCTSLRTTVFFNELFTDIDDHADLPNAQAPE